VQQPTCEIWLPVPGYEGFYEVSDLGRVYSLPRLTTKGRKGGRLLTGSRTPSGHIAVMLSKHGNIRRWMVHHLVAGAFIGPRPAGYETRHANDIGSDNRLVNLSYGTSGDNKLDMVRNGRHYYANRTHCPKGHPYDEVNTYRTPKGGRDCRACNNAKTKARKKRQSNGIGNPCRTPDCTQVQTARGLCPKCYIRKQRAERRGPDWAKRTCGHCGVPFEIAPDETALRKYCSDECSTGVRRIAARDRARRLRAAAA
jgi:hypothetical protein